MRAGVRIGVDVGDVRIGVSVSDPSGLLATPVETVPAGATSVRAILAIAEDRRAVEIVVGLPRSLSGDWGPAAHKVRGYAEELARSTPLPVRLVDERMSTVTAEHALREVGRKGKKRRAVVDQAAAVVILQSALDAERSQGRAPGELVEVAR
ncbi:putative Holliday junction resolvase [Mumia flava]|uniref:Putative pre-16S rRNA nuclease n=1 Tax=Mumia flava TaxID=1348852 RepID=A0A0B2BC99_9ACTN|nr:Holliday junction resolvase RuvX [Mumia flava]PJJ55864.1 putative Holliday junction resolvase [Mumia flava]